MRLRMKKYQPDHQAKSINIVLQSKTNNKTN